MESIELQELNKRFLHFLIISYHIMSDVQNSQLHAAPNKSWAVGTGVEYVAQIARASVEVIEANRIAQTVPETPLEILCTDVRWLGQDR